MLGSAETRDDAAPSDSVEPEGPVAAPAIAREDASRTVRVGFIPLLDIAVLVAAVEQGFAAREGLNLQLIKDVSWANIRDRLAFHQFDVAHMLAPMTVASHLGLGSNPSAAFAPFALGRGGNAITLSTALYREMQKLGDLDGSEGALANALALRRVIEARRAEGRKPLVFAMTYPFSSHNYEFRFWMGTAGIHPDRDVIMTVVPPPLTADAITAGAIDGFCVNAPWNMIAVARGVGRVVAVKADLWPAAPEKVLGVRPDWAESHPETLSRLLVALDAAARWCDEPGNRAPLAAMLADAAYVGAPEDIVRTLLTDRFLVDPDGRMRDIPKYLTFYEEAANFPWVSEALWLYSQMVRWGQTSLSDDGAARAAAAYRPGIYRAAVEHSGTPIPRLDRKTEGSSAPVTVPTLDGSLTLRPDPFIDGRPFYADRLAEYVAGFPIATPPGGSPAGDTP